jgi:membrane protein DedA with SNARE-associated domain
MLDLLIDVLTAPLEALNWLTDQLFLLLNALFERFGTPIVFFAALAEATVGLGVIFPGVLLLFLGGAFARGDGSELALVLVLGIAGTILGDTISYTLGRFGSSWVVESRFGSTVRLGASLMSGRTRWLIPFYHLHSATRAVGPFGAGVIRLPLRMWMPLDYAGAAIANSIWIGAGAVLGRAVLTEDGLLEQHPALRIGLAVGATVWLLMMHRVLQQKLAQLRECSVQP